MATSNPAASSAAAAAAAAAAKPTTGVGAAVAAGIADSEFANVVAVIVALAASMVVGAVLACLAYRRESTCAYMPKDASYAQRGAYSQTVGGQNVAPPRGPLI